jgi:hypothetical protein
MGACDRTKTRPQQERVLYGGEDRIRTCDRGFRPGNRLAGGPIRPLWHLPNLMCSHFFWTTDPQGALQSRHYWLDGGGSGIRTHVGVTQTCFQDMRLQPLGHPSTKPHMHLGRRRFYHNIGQRRLLPGLLRVPNINSTLSVIASPLGRSNPISCPRDCFLTGLPLRGVRNCRAWSSSQ